MQLYIVRHPETEWNKEGRFQGQTDIPISTEGYEDLQRTLPLLSSLPVDIIYTSPLKRAKSVAQEVSRVTELPYFEDARIMEVNCGIWEGRTIDDLSQKEPSLFEMWWSHPYQFQIPGGESYEQVETRTSQFLQEVITKKQNALIVSHGVAILTMLRYVLNIPKEHVRTLRVENLGLIKLDADSSGISFSIINPSHLFPATNVPRKKTEAEADI